MELHTNRTHDDFTPRTCQCALCRKHGASWISDPEGEARVSFKDREGSSFYRFGHGTSDFICCSKCGVLMIAVCDIEGRDRAVLNVTAMSDEVFTAEPIKTNFDGENVEGRLDRRGQNWTGRVVFEG